MALFYKTEIKRKEIIQEYVKGVATITSTPITTFQGNVQPYKGKITQDQTEGVISSGVMLVFSEEKLNIPTSNTATKGTYVLYHGDWYECVKELDWSDQKGVFADLSYYRYVMVWREADV